MTRKVVIDGRRTDRRSFEVHPQKGRHETCPACKEPSTDLRSVKLGSHELKICNSCEGKIYARAEAIKARKRREDELNSEVRDSIRNLDRRKRPQH